MPATRARSETAPTCESVAQFKRLNERIHAEAAFRQAFVSNPLSHAAEAGVVLPPDELERLAAYLARPHHERGLAQLGPGARNHFENLQAGLAEREAIKHRATPSNPRFRAWRQRQMHRTLSEQGQRVGEGLLYLPAAIELSKGCSVGCWFCGVSAPKLSELFPLTDDNAGLFEKTIAALVAVCGKSAVSTSPLYWATDPLDNPDFERYAERFLELTGGYPNFTTALALRDVKRTRRLLARTREAGEICRFSVLSLAMLRRLHRTFSPEEMAHVECVLVNKESNLVKANAGRFREKAETHPDLLDHERSKLAAAADGQDVQEPGSIACVAGFLFNLVDRSVRLITPCRADDEWPHGYRELDVRQFHADDDLTALLEAMIDQQMSAQLPVDMPLAFRPDLAYDETPNGFSLTSTFRRLRLEHLENGPLIRRIGSLLHKRHYTAATLRARLDDEGSRDTQTIDELLVKLFRQGALNENPSWLERPASGLRILAAD